MKNKLSYEELTEQWYNSLDEIKELKKELEDLKLINKINIAMDKGEQIKDIIKSLKEQK